MDSRVELMPKASEDIDAVSRWITEKDSFDAAETWYFGIMDAITSLSVFPAACPLSPEGHVLNLEIRQKLYGNRRSAYRILFEITSDDQGALVRVLRVRHSSQKHLRFDEFNLN